MNLSKLGDIKRELFMGIIKTTEHGVNVPAMIEVIDSWFKKNIITIGTSYIFDIPEGMRALEKDREMFEKILIRKIADKILQETCVLFSEHKATFQYSLNANIFCLKVTTNLGDK